MTHESSSPDSEREAFKEKLRSLRFGRVPGGNREGKSTFRPAQKPSWEAGIAGEHRPDGSFMPYLRDNGETYVPIRAKEFGEDRRNIEEQVKRLKTDEGIFKAEREGK